MHAWEQIQKSVGFIEGHLNEETSLETLAEKASLSPFYFQRLFRRLVKKPPAEYIKLRRMAKAAEHALGQCPNSLMHRPKKSSSPLSTHPETASAHLYGTNAPHPPSP